jgi:hypothetical protein
MVTSVKYWHLCILILSEKGIFLSHQWCGYREVEAASHGKREHVQARREQDRHHNCTMELAYTPHAATARCQALSQSEVEFMFLTHESIQKLNTLFSIKIISTMN